MSKKNNNYIFADKILNELFPPETLNDLFERRIKELDIPPTNALDILEIEYRALQGILKGSSRRVDYTNFRKIANFLKIPRDKVISLYFDELEKNFPESAPYPQDKIDFIKDNFDLAALRKVGLIKSITDYRDIENRINKRFGFKSIFEYKPIKRGIAFSSGSVQPKNLNNRELWIEQVIDMFKELANPFDYDKEKLIKYIPSIRKHCINVDGGLHDVIRDLFKLGVSVIYQSPLSSINLRGATVVVNNKPCIVITDYKGFYPTLWFALMHEIFHVLFDLDEINSNIYHVTDEDPEGTSLVKKEEQANNFAREYLFSREKSVRIRPHLTNKIYVAEFAERNNVHPSFIYVFHAFDADKDDVKAWPKAQKHNPDFSKLIEPLDLKWSEDRTISEHVKYLRDVEIYK